MYIFVLSFHVRMDCWVLPTKLV